MPVVNCPRCGQPIENINAPHSKPDGKGGWVVCR